MKCDELVAYLSDYIDGDLDEPLRADAQEHLATCRNCHVVLDTTQQMIVLLRRSGPQAIPMERRRALFKTLQAVFARRAAGSAAGTTQ